MNIFKKIGNIFSTKGSRTLVTYSKYGNVNWTPKNYENFIKESYMKNVIAFRCMDYKAKSVALVPWKVFKKSGTGREEIEGHYFNEIIKRPNPQYGWTMLMLRATVYLDANGNSFFERIGPDTGSNSGKVMELYNLRPDKFKIERNSSGQIINYIYDNTLFFPVNPLTGESDILHVKLFNPLDETWGLSMTEPTALEIDSGNEATNWNKKILENEGRPGMIVTAGGGGMSQAQYDRLEKHIKDTYAGSNNAGTALILEGTDKIDAKPYNWSPKEMDWIESNRELARRICLGYSVPPMLLGIPGDNKYSNMIEARQAFWEEVIIFYLRHFKSELNNWLFKNEENIFIDYIINDVPAFELKRTMLWKRAEQANFLTINEKREMVGYEKIEGGDALLVPASMLPLDMAGQDINNDGTEEQDQEDEKNVIEDLIKEGFTADEARELIGVPIKND